MTTSLSSYTSSPFVPKTFFVNFWFDLEDRLLLNHLFYAFFLLFCTPLLPWFISSFDPLDSPYVSTLTKTSSDFSFKQAETSAHSFGPHQSCLQRTNRLKDQRREKRSRYYHSLPDGHRGGNKWSAELVPQRLKHYACIYKSLLAPKRKWN